MTWKRWVFGGLVVAYGVSLFALTWGMQGTMNSPDESANQFFAEQFSTTGSFVVEQEFYEASFGLLHPRSMTTFAGALLPGSFLGLPVLAGSFLKVFGEGAAFFVTPIFVILGLLAWRSTVKHLFGSERLANLSVFFLAIHPGFWYYGMRVMMHNAAFLACLMIGLWFFIAKPLRLHVHWVYLDALLGGLMLGIALFFRGSEVLWVIAMAGILLLIALFKKWIKWPFIIAAVFGIFLGLLPTLYFNAETFGDPVATGYTVTESLIEVTSGGAIEQRSLIATVLFPFGFHERVLLRNSWRYIFGLYPWISIFSLIGFVWFLTTKKDRKKNEWKMFTGAGVGISLWLVLMYASWVVHDNPDPNAITLANSYVRYWLPIFAIGSVFAAYTINQLWAKRSYYRSMMIGLILLCAFGLSVNLIWFGIDGVLETRQNLESYQVKRDIVLDLTETDAIIVVDYADKYLFPHREVVVPLRSEHTYSHLPALRELAPLYYYGITLPETDLVYLQEEKLIELGLTIEPIEEVFNETLYRIDYPR
jgi:hypothetical protein